MSSELVELEVQGRRYSGWESVSVSKAIDAIAGSFSAEIAASDPFPIAPNAVCRVLVDGEVLLDGFVDAARTSLSEDRHTIAVAGRDRTADLVDCSAMNSPGEWYGIGLSDLVAELAAPFGIDVVDERAFLGDVFPRFSLAAGETAFEAIERACRLRGVFPTSDGVGIVLARPGSAGKAEVVLAEGSNALGVTAEVDFAQRYGTYIVRGQAQGSDLFEAAESALAEGRSEDPAARKARTLLVVGETAMFPGVAQNRAKWEAVVRAARGTRWTCGVQAWREKPGGELWRPNRVVLCQFPKNLLAIGDLLVTSCKYTFDGDGTRVALTLSRRDAFIPEVPLKREKEPTTFGADVDLDEGGG